MYAKPNSETIPDGHWRLSSVDCRFQIAHRDSSLATGEPPSDEPRATDSMACHSRESGNPPWRGHLALVPYRRQSLPRACRGDAGGTQGWDGLATVVLDPCFRRDDSGGGILKRSAPLSLPNGLGMVFRREAMPISPAIPRRHRWPDGKAAPLSLPPIGFSMVRLRSPQVYECRVPIPIENRHSTIGNGVHAFLLATKIASRIPGTSLLFCPGSRYPPRQSGPRTSRKRYIPDSRSPSKH